VGGRWGGEQVRESRAPEIAGRKLFQKKGAAGDRQLLVHQTRHGGLQDILRVTRFSPAQVKVLTIASVITAPWSLYYLLVFPALVADRSVPPTIGTVVVALLVYIQLWLLVAEYAYTAASSLYNLPHAYLNPILRILFGRNRRRRISLFRTVFSCLSSYFLSIYGFALAYTSLSHADPHAFTGGRLSLFTASYFSLVTATTVGYGDIAPVTVSARSLAMAEIMLSLIYLIFFFSVLAGGIREVSRTSLPHQGQRSRQRRSRCGGDIANEP
jgi:Ion channel